MSTFHYPHCTPMTALTSCLVSRRLYFGDCGTVRFSRPSHEAPRSCFSTLFPRNELCLGSRQTSEPLGYNFGWSSIMIIAEAFWCAHLNKGKLTNTRNCKVVLLPYYNLQNWCWKVQVDLYQRFGSNLAPKLVSVHITG